MSPTLIGHIENHAPYLSRLSQAGIHSRRVGSKDGRTDRRRYSRVEALSTAIFHRDVGVPRSCCRSQQSVRPPIARSVCSFINTIENISARPDSVVRRFSVPSGCPVGSFRAALFLSGCREPPGGHSSGCRQLCDATFESSRKHFQVL